jgi:hypothetical protein
MRLVGGRKSQVSPMSEPKRISIGKAMYRELQRANRHLLRELQKAKREVQALEAANVNLRVELEAADHLLGTAMDELLDQGQP